jgi:hypothetical protein
MEFEFWKFSIGSCGNFNLLAILKRSAKHFFMKIPMNGPQTVLDKMASKNVGVLGHKQLILFLMRPVNCQCA